MGGKRNTFAKSITTGFLSKSSTGSERSTLLEASTFRIPSTIFTEEITELSVTSRTRDPLVLFTVVVRAIRSVERVGKSRNVNQVSNHQAVGRASTRHSVSPAYSCVGSHFSYPKGERVLPPRYTRSVLKGKVCNLP